MPSRKIVLWSIIVLNRPRKYYRLFIGWLRYIYSILLSEILIRFIVFNQIVYNLRFLNALNILSVFLTPIVEIINTLQNFFLFHTIVLRKDHLLSLSFWKYLFVKQSYIGRQIGRLLSYLPFNCFIYFRFMELTFSLQ